VLGSLVFHGVLLFGLSLNRESERAAALPAPIAARLVEPQASPATAAPQPEPPKPRVEEAPPAPVVKPAPAPKPNPIAKAEPTTPTAKPAPVAPAPAAPSAEITPSPPAAGAPAAPGPLVKAEPQPAAPASSEQDTGLAQYRRDVMRMAAKYKRYPRVALDNNWEGTAVVRVIVGANGAIASISVISSSGHQVLDKQALDMIQKAKGGVPIPPALRGKEFPLEIPVIYNVKDQGAG
jgi:protein TonB